MGRPRTLDDIAFRIGAARKSLAAGELDIAKVHLEQAAGLVNAARVDVGLNELKHAAVIETRELGFDLSDARGDT